MADAIRAALERLLELEERDWCTQDWVDAIAAARAAMAADGPAVQSREPASVVGEPSDNDILACMIEAASNVPDGQAIGITDWDREAIAAARAVLARYGHHSPPPVEGEVGVLLRELRDAAFDLDGSDPAKAMLTRAADLLAQRHPAPVPVAERLPELRGMFERILCVARSSGQRPVGNIDLADRLISAVVSWAALPLPAGEVKP